MTACRLAVYWIWNIFRNVHGCRRKVLESPSVLKSQKRGILLEATSQGHVSDAPQLVGQISRSNAMLSLVNNDGSLN